MSKNRHFIQAFFNPEDKSFYRLTFTAPLTQLSLIQTIQLLDTTPAVYKGSCSSPASLTVTVL